MNLALTLEATAERDPRAEALVDGDVRLTWTDVRDRVARVAGGLAGLGVDEGDRVVALLANRHEAVLLYWACQWLGAWFVPLNFRLTVDEVAYCAEDAGAKLIAYEPAARAGRTVAERLGVAAVAVAGEQEDAAPFARLADAEPRPAAEDLDPGSISLMLYTSGTTGRPKGVPRSHRADRAGGLAQALHHGLAPGDRTLGVMPLYHTMGLHSMVAMALVGGCFVCLPKWDAADALALVASERLTSLYLAPTLYHDLLAHEACRRTDFSRLRSVGYAGSPMTPTLARRCAEALAPEVFFNHYGSTEIYLWSIHRDQRAKPGCAGRPGVNSRLRLVALDADAGPDEVVTPGEEGQIICDLRSDEAFGGYWQRPDADAENIRAGWYFTGDVGRLDEDGDLWVVGRTDDMIISGGENIQPIEVEDLLLRHPGVEEAVVVGVPDERWGQRVVAHVVAAQGELDPGELDRFCREDGGLAAFKRPREYRFRDDLPKSATGKVLRRELRDEEGT
jgi:2-furoate---CoA ligase